MDNWMPIRIFSEAGEQRVDWCHMGDVRFKQPFFEDTIRQRFRAPFALLFRKTTSLDALREVWERTPGFGPSGFVFHMSRCGSTLVSQMFAALASNIVISEAPPIDSVLRSGKSDDRVEQLRWLISAYGRQRFPGESRLFVKFDSWSLIELGVIQEAFPDTPWIFLYRDPIEVLVSQVRQPGIQMVPGLVDGLVESEQDVLSLSREEYCSRVLERICSAAVDHLGNRNGLFINYSALPGAFSTIVRHFNLSFSRDEMEVMNESARFNAKTPQMFFSSDSAEKQRLATPAIRAAAERLAALYERLENARCEEITA